jgi:hypothetical protein
MNHKLLLRTVLFLASLFVLSAYSCTNSLPPTTSGPGFLIETEFFSLEGSLFPTPVGNVVTGWTWKNDVAGFTAVGDASPFQNQTNVIGIGVSDNGRVPALWDVSWKSGGPPECIGAPEDPVLGQFQSNPGRITEVICFERPNTDSVQLQSQQTFTFNPSPIYTDGSSGSTATISGSGLSTQYGMPLLRYFDMTGNLVTQTNVTAVASDGSWATAPIPDVSQLQLGGYAGFIYNANASGGYDYLGTTSVMVLDPPPPPPPDGGCGGTGGIANTCN